MAGPAGLEPVTSRVTGECSNQLSYGPSLQFALLSVFAPQKTFSMRLAPLSQKSVLVTRRVTALLIFGNPF